MKILCDVCHKEIDINELKYVPGETIIADCFHCGNVMYVTIPTPEVKAAAPKVKYSSSASETIKSEDVILSSSSPNPNFYEEVLTVGETSASVAPKKKVVRHRNPKSKSSVKKQTEGIYTGILVPPPLPSNELLPQEKNEPNTTKRKPSQLSSKRLTPRAEQHVRTRGMGWKSIVISILLVIVIIVLRMYGDNEHSDVETPKLADSVSVAVEEGSESYNVVESDHYYEDEESYEGDKDMDEEVEETVFLGPTSTDLTSSQAYSVYDEWISDISLGDNWESSDFIQEKINSEQVLYRLSASGYIKTNPVEFEAVQLKDKTIYGRYRNSNGTKLDLNGVEDADGNLIIKLGHGSATSFWILHIDYHEDTSNAIEYSGSWGKSNADTNLRCEFKDPPLIRKHVEVEGYVFDNGRKYPFTIEYYKEGNKLSDAKYVNSDYNTRVMMNTATLSNGRYRFTGNLGGEKFIIQYDSSSPYKGTMSVGSRVAEIKMNLSSTTK